MTSPSPDNLTILLQDLAAQAATLESLAPAAVILSEYQTRISQGQTIAIVGEVKKGKSSLINALTGISDLSPVSSDVATSVALRLRHGTPRIEVEYYPPPGQTTALVETIAREAVPSYATEDGNPANMKQVDAIHVYAQSPLLASGISLLDTPGLGGLFRNHAAVTWRHVPSADAVLFVTDSIETVLTKDEVDYIQQLLKLGKYLLYVQTKSDAADAEHVVGWKKRNLEILAEATGKPATGIAYFCVSSRLAAKADTAPAEQREKLLKRSGIDDLRKFITERLGASRRKQAETRALADLKALLANATKAAAERASQANAAAVGDLIKVEQTYLERKQALTDWLQTDHRVAVRAFGQVVADAQRESSRIAKAALQTTAASELYRVVELELNSLLDNPGQGLQARVDGLIERSREGCTAVTVEICTRLRQACLEQLMAQSKSLLDGGYSANLDLDVDAAVAAASAAATTIEVDEPRANRLEHVMTSMSLAMSIGGAASALFPPVGLITGVAVLWWMSSRKAHEANAKGLAQMRTKLLPSVQGEFRSALATTLQLIEDVVTQIRRAGEELFDAAAAKRRSELAQLQDWLVAQRNKGKDDQRIAVEQAKATVVLVQGFSARLQQLTAPPAPKGA